MIDAPLELLQSTRDLIGEQMAFLITGQQMGEPQARRIINQLPSASLLTTTEGKKTFAAKLAKAQRFMLIQLRNNVAATPEAFTAADRIMILSTELPSVSEALKDPTEEESNPFLEEFNTLNKKRKEQ